jgi:hypothetical protein
VSSCSRLGSVSFLFMGPLILAFLAVVNVMTWDGEWWIQWPALGIGIAWVINLFKLFRTVLVAGGLAALAAYVAGRK